MTITATVYHGTADEIREFSHEFMGFNTSNNAGAFYFTSEKEVAFDYSRSSYYRKHECDDEYVSGDYEIDDKKLNADAEKQQHIYECEVTFDNPLILDIEEVERVDNYGCNKGMGILDSAKICAIVNIMQGRRFEQYMDYDINECISVDEIIQYFEEEEWNEETQEYDYIDKEQYDGVIIRNAIDNCTEIYVPSDIYVVLHPCQITIKNRLTE